MRLHFKGLRQSRQLCHSLSSSSARLNAGLVCLVVLPRPIELHIWGHATLGNGERKVYWYRQHFFKQFSGVYVITLNSLKALQALHTHIYALHDAGKVAELSNPSYI